MEFKTYSAKDVIGNEEDILKKYQGFFTSDKVEERTEQNKNFGHLISRLTQDILTQMYGENPDISTGKHKLPKSMRIQGKNKAEIYANAHDFAYKILNELHKKKHNKNLAMEDLQKIVGELSPGLTLDRLIDFILDNESLDDPRLTNTFANWAADYLLEDRRELAHLRGHVQNEVLMGDAVKKYALNLASKDNEKLADMGHSDYVGFLESHPQDKKKAYHDHKKKYVI